MTNEITLLETVSCVEAAVHRDWLLVQQIVKGSADPEHLTYGILAAFGQVIRDTYAEQQELFLGNSRENSYRAMGRSEDE